jgi:hypothetical protein
MSAKIIPSYRIDHLPGKKVDYVLFIDPDGQDSQQGAHEAVQTLREKLQENSINHSSFPPLRERPVTVSIETKRGGDHEQKARLQMGVWQASQWKLLSELAGAGLEELPLIPGIVVQGHQWRFVATSRRDGKTVSISFALCFFDHNTKCHSRLDSMDRPDFWNHSDNPRNLSNPGRHLPTKEVVT